ncbi:hypothetical protein VNO78_13170 [Psophocarpus tetragonolobus]|uniref:Uncharacterized protein n=1 Tax=Psophocarpus tetragonolobus TaxID=3891 RepID=A0AAN9SYP0_PSOTE
MKTSEFEFHLPVFVSSIAVPNDVVFCGKVITRRTGPENRVLLRSESSSDRTTTANGFAAWLQSPSSRESRRRRRSESFRRRYNMMFGTVMKFPLQMELSDIKMRQERREPPPPQPMARFAVEDSGKESCWELVRPLRRRGMLKSALFGCLPIV